MIKLIIVLVTVLVATPMCVQDVYAEPRLDFWVYNYGTYDKSYRALWGLHSWNKPRYGWIEDGRFLVEFFCSDTASDVIDRNSGSLLVDGNILTITFKYRPIIIPPNAPALSWASVPMLLQFLISDLPEQDYAVEVRRLEGEPKYVGRSSDPQTTP